MPAQEEDENHHEKWNNYNEFIAGLINTGIYK